MNLIKFSQGDVITDPQAGLFYILRGDVAYKILIYSD